MELSKPDQPEYNTQLHHTISPDQLPIERDLSQFLFETVELSPFIDIESWKHFFDTISPDPYIKEGYRYKSIAWFRIKHQAAAAIEGIDEHIAAVNQLSDISPEVAQKFLSTAPPDWCSEETGYCCWNLPQYALQQSIKFNPVHGDLRREYPRISNTITDSRDFQRLLVHYAAYFGWSDAIVLIQFQRVDCTMDRIGLPAVEGFHQDGNRHVGMLIVNRNNITPDSGVSQYALDDKGRKTDALVVNKTIPAGQMIYWNDKRLWHYGTELKVADPKLNAGRGFRDIILMSAKTPPANMPMGPVPDQYRG